MPLGFAEGTDEIRGVHVDARPLADRCLQWLSSPRNFGRCCLAFGLMIAVFPVFVFPLCMVMGFAMWLHSLVLQPMPARYPKDLGGLDPSFMEPDRGEEGTPPKPAEASFFFGNERSRFPNLHGREVWVTKGDLTTHLFMAAATGGGKAQPVDEPVLTPTGWKPIGTLVAGDVVMQPNGASVPVRSVHPQGVLPIFEVRFEDGRCVRACADHFWVAARPLTGCQLAPPMPMTTRAIAEALSRGLAVYLPLTNFPSGASHRSSAAAHMQEDDGGDTVVESSVGVEQQSCAQRLAFLRAACARFGQVADDHVVVRLACAAVAREIQRAAWSIGGIADLMPLSANDQWVVRIWYRSPAQLFHVGSAQAREADWLWPKRPYGLRVVSVGEVGQSEAVCIKLANADGLYVSRDWVVTHNTETLLGMAANALCWGSGFSFSDAKAQNTLVAKVYTLARRMYRDDDMRVINYITGGIDPFGLNELQAERDPHAITSHAANLFSEAPMDFINELLISMLPKADGSSGPWQQKAVNMMRAVVRVACYLRSIGEITVSVTTLREMMSLPYLEKLYERGERGEIPEEAFAAIRAYLISGLSWDPAKYKQKKPQSDEVRTQHGYLTGQFLAPLGMLGDTYGHIYRKQLPEVDQGDVMLRRRLLVVAIPPLEKSPQETANLGKLNIGAQRLMMAKNLGSAIEGSYKEIFESNATTSDSPYLIFWDEVGYQFAPGIDVVTAQARSLNFSIIAAGQDLSAMRKEGKEEVDTLIANTRIKIALALEDPSATFELFSKIAGEAHYYRASGTEQRTGLFATNYVRMTSNSVEKAPRVTLQELQALGSGQGVMMWKSRVIRFNAFYPFGDLRPVNERNLRPRKAATTKQNGRGGAQDTDALAELPGVTKLYRLPRFLQCKRPQLQALLARSQPIEGGDGAAKVARLLELLRHNDSPFRWHQDAVSDSPMLRAVAKRAAELKIGEAGIERGIKLYMAAVKSLRAAAPAAPTSSAVTQGGTAPLAAGAPSSTGTTASASATTAAPTAAVEIVGETEPTTLGSSAGAAKAEIVFDPLAFLDAPPLEMQPAAAPSPATVVVREAQKPQPADPLEDLDEGSWMARVLAQQEHQRALESAAVPSTASSEKATGSADGDARGSLAEIPTLPGGSNAQAEENVETQVGLTVEALQALAEVEQLSASLTPQGAQDVARGVSRDIQDIVRSLAMAGAAERMSLEEIDALFNQISAAVAAKTQQGER